MIDKIRVDATAAFRLLVAIALLSCIAVFLVRTIHWPILGDASLMHYVVFLMDRGAVPYRDIAEMNMPGSYFVDWEIVHLFGGGQLAWRWFDFLLSVSAIVAMVAIAFPLDWFAGFWAGSLFLLLHGRDGMLELGQRDLTVSACLLAGYAVLFLSLRYEWPVLASIFGLLTGFAGTVKPTVPPLGLLSLFVVHLQLKRTRRQSWKFLICGAAGLLFPGIGVLFLLWRERATGAFLITTSSMVVYHASLARRSVGYLLLHSVSPLLPLVIGWLVVIVLQRKRLSWERVHLLLGLGFGLLSYLLQAKGYSYQRYPFLAFLLLLMAIDFAAAMNAGGGVVRLLGVAGLAFGGFFLAPVSTAMASHYDWREPGTVGMLEEDLGRLGPAELSRGVQCVDSIGGCTNALYRMKLAETSYVFYDEFLFGADSAPAVEQNRKKFMRDLRLTPPAVIIVTDRLFPAGPDNYQKLSRWPQFKAIWTSNTSSTCKRRRIGRFAGGADLRFLAGTEST